jgi:hypothetical protein
MTDTDHGLLTIDDAEQDLSDQETIPVRHTELNALYHATPDDDGILRTGDGEAFSAGAYEIADIDTGELDTWG